MDNMDRSHSECQIELIGCSQVCYKPGDLINRQLNPLPRARRAKIQPRQSQMTFMIEIGGMKRAGI